MRENTAKGELLAFPDFSFCSDNKLAKDVLIDIADEERVHAGEFLRLLHELAPDEQKLYEEGAKEVQEMIDRLNKDK